MKVNLVRMKGLVQLLFTKLTLLISNVCVNLGMLEKTVQSGVS